MRERDRFLGTLAISVTMLMWGFNFIATKLALRDIDPFALMQIRHVFSALLFILILKFKSGSVISEVKTNWKKVLPVSFLGIVANQIFYLWGLNHTTPSHSALMYTLLPIFTAIFAWLLIGEKINLVRWFGILIAFVGAVWLVTEGRFDFGGDKMAGDIITLGAVITFSLFLVLAKPVLSSIGVIRTLGIAYILTLPVVPIFCLVPSIQQDWTAITSTSWAGTFYLILFGTVLAYLAHQYSLKRLSSAVIAAFAYTQPVLAAVFSVLVLGENLPSAFYISAILIFSGLLIAQKRVTSGMK